MVTSLLQGLEWRQIGPFRGGRSVAVAGDPVDPATFYFGTTGGGVWKTTDGGQYWQNVSDGFFRRASVGALAVAPADPNVIYVGMGETTIRGNVSHGDGVYMSTDAGKTWRHLGLERTRNIGKVHVHSHDPDLVYVAAFGHAHGPNPERGLYRSADGGATWDLVLAKGEDAGANDLAIDPTNPRHLYASFWQARRGPYRMTSGGPGCGLHKSTDGGLSWTELTDNPGLPKGPKGKIGIAASPAKSGRVWALVEAEKGGLFRSDDGGATWERLSEDHNLRQRPWYYMHVVADPRDPETVWVLNVELWRSVDSGATFKKVPAPHGDHHDLWIDPNDPRRMILGNDGGGTVTFNGGLSWSTLYNQPTAEFYHVTVDTRTPYRVYGAQQDNTTMSVPSRSVHDAITTTEWYEVGGCESGYIAVRPDDPNVVYAGCYQGILTRYDHATGQLRDISIWPEEYTGWGAKDYKFRFNWTSPTVLSRHDPTTLYHGGNHVFRSRDEGASWEVISPDLSRNDPSTQEPSGGDITRDNTGTEVYGTVFTIAESPLQRGLIWAGTDDGLVHLTRDAGATWEDVTPPELPEWSLVCIVEASPHDAATAYLAATRYKHDDFRPYLFKTSDFGRTWTRISDGIPEDDFTRVVREDPDRRGLLYAGTETGVYASFDDGASWHRLGGNVPVVPIHDLVLAQDDLVLGTHGRSFWILDDVTLLRRLAETAADGADASATRLFKPRDTVRFASIRGFDKSRVPGKNWGFAAGMIPAFDVAKTPDGETKTTYLDAGANPPPGVIIHYALAEKPAKPITLTFLDAAGTELRTVSSKSEEPDEAEPTAAGAAEVPPTRPEADEADEEPFVPARPGLNRFVWDLRVAPATKIEPKGGERSDRKGPVVPPGSYQVRLQVGDQTFVESFAVRKDPRIAASQADLDAQFALGRRVRDKLDETNQAINAIRRARKQLDVWIERAKDGEAGDRVTAAAKALEEQLDGIEGELIQVKAESPQDTLNHPVKLNTKLSNLAASVGTGDVAPTTQAQELFADLSRRVDEQLGRLRALTEGEGKAFNDLIREAGLPAVAIAAPDPPP